MTTKKHSRVAIVYDFDGTLARGNMQDHSFLPQLGLDCKAFWDHVKREAKKHDADEILTYMRLMLDYADHNNKIITRKMLARHGARIPLFDGVESWFRRIDKFARNQGLRLHHYVISSGNLEIIEGSAIANRFRKVFASSFIYDKKRAVWPGVAINYTTKTQFLWRLNKGIENTWDNTQINRWVPILKRPLPFSRMVFIGDGDTDIPSMKTVKTHGGYSIAVFDPKEFPKPNVQQKVARLIAEDRVHFVAPADYKEGSQLDVTVKGVMARIAEKVRQDAQ